MNNSGNSPDTKLNLLMILNSLKKQAFFLMLTRMQVLQKFMIYLTTVFSRIQVKILV